MVVLMISQEYPPYLVGGVGTHVQQLARGLVAVGHTIHVFSFSMDHTFTAMDEGVNIHFLQLPFAGRQNQYEGQVSDLEHSSRILLLHIEDVIRQTGISPDLVHMHEWFCIGCAERLKAKLGVPLVVTCHMVQGWLMENLRPHPEAPQICHLEKKGYLSADKVIAVSNSVRAEIISRYSVNESAAEVIFNGLDIESFRSLAASVTAVEAERRQLKLVTNKLIVFAGRITPQKGVSGLLRSAMHVLRHRKDILYAIAGRLEPNGYSDSLVMMARTHPLLRDKVLFPGHVSRARLALLYKLAALVVVPSLYEPFGYAAIEPMVLGKPVVATRTGGLAEIIENERSGLLVSLVKDGRSYDLDIQKFCQAQLRLLADPKLAKSLGECAQERILALFSISHMVTATVQLYRSVIQSSTPLAVKGIAT
jgi:glycosyltransferase involved in cell wall biosynthesis